MRRDEATRPTLCSFARPAHTGLQARSIPQRDPQEILRFHASAAVRSLRLSRVNAGAGRVHIAWHG
jgi:hypothetical protein